MPIFCNASNKPTIMQLPKLFQSKQQFRQTFVQGLDCLLQQHDELGVAILVIANASFDAAIWQNLKPNLRKKFQQLSQQINQESTDHFPIDDLSVFQQLNDLGFDQLKLTQFRQIHLWEIQYNQLRSFRPPRNANNKIDLIKKDFDPDSFHFNKPFLQKEILWQGQLGQRQVRLLYNKFPFVELHALLVPDPEKQLPQFLRQQDHQYLWQITHTLGQSINGIGFGYNSYGAFSSVNHLHFQLFVRQHPLPVCDVDWQHNGGEKPYPIQCFHFHETETAWLFIDKLHQQNTSYNLVYLPDSLYILPREKQGHYTSASWTGGFAWYELAGGFTTFNQDDFNQLSASSIRQELNKLSPTITTNN